MKDYASKGQWVSPYAAKLTLGDVLYASAWGLVGALFTMGLLL